jgi:hypothetical protein
LNKQSVSKRTLARKKKLLSAIKCIYSLFFLFHHGSTPDGKMCSWSLDMLAQPQETLELQQKQSKAVAVTSLSFPAGDVNNFIVGSEEGAVYTACR